MSTKFSADDLPNRFDFETAEPRIYRQWEARGYFHSEPDPDREPYTIVIPPPNVTGALHLGHALNNTLQDVLIRFKRMQGYNALWMPGTDHAGIATQAVVERRLRTEEGKTRHDLGRERLVSLIWQWKQEYEQRILGQLRQMGASCDWQRTRFTLDDVCARAVRQTFFDLFGKEKIYRGKRLVNWDTYLQTAVSDDEVVHETIKGHFWHFRYPVIDPRPGEPTHVTIATTRPETMLGDTAVAVHPDPAKALDKAEEDLVQKLATAPQKERGAVQRQLDDLRQRRETMLPQLTELRDMALAGRRLLLPLVDREIPLVADPWAKPELGSGCVKITPAHDANDYEVGRRCHLPMINILLPDGTLNAQAGPYQGMTIAKAREQVIADLEAKGLLVEIEDREIDLAHSDRSKTPIEPYLADQWFVKMDQLAQSAMDAVTSGQVKIFPERYVRGYLDWLSEKRDWPVSRQLWWGHQIPIWSLACNDQQQVDATLAKLQKLSHGRDHELIYSVESSDEAGSQIVGAGDERFATVHVCLSEDDPQLISALERDGFVREEDVLDTWFSSALWPHSTLGWPENTEELRYYYPTSTLITSRDIITLWVARMVLAGLNNAGDVPFREVFIHPKILDGYGEGMSKSKGNGVDPLDVIKKFGADALRFGLAHLTTDTQDVRMPVQFECPHCHELMDQTKKNRELPRVECKKCGKSFATQWARSDADKMLPRGAVVSDRFELARNFANKLWNASRFALTKLDGFTPGPVTVDQLLVEDRWILSRLHTVTQKVGEALDGYHYAEAARVLYDFAWDEFCSFYIEMVKERLGNDEQREVAQRVLAHTLDTLLRLLHPIMPFITEEIWQLQRQLTPQRGLPKPTEAAESVMLAPWPKAEHRQFDRAIEEQFARFQTVLGAIREIRSRQQIPPKADVQFSVRCTAEMTSILRPMEPYFQALARAENVGWGVDVSPPANCGTINLGDLEVYVDLAGFLDVEAEIQRNEKLLQKIVGSIRGKENKLSNASFVDKAPADIVEKERESLVQLKQQLAAVEKTLDELRRLK
ncbi:MAG: valine--tRNA ligase [Pirellulaceae bacterium]